MRRTCPTTGFLTSIRISHRLPRPTLSPGWTRLILLAALGQLSQFKVAASKALATLLPAGSFNPSLELEATNYSAALDQIRALREGGCLLGWQASMVSGLVAKCD